jgi:hypothetical protein
MAALRLPARTGRPLARSDLASASTGRVGHASACRPLAPRAPCMRRVSPNPAPAPPSTTALHAKASRRRGAPPAEPQESSPFSTTALVGLALWAAFLAYATLLSPNQTPTRDEIFVLKLCGLGDPGSAPVNAVFTALWAAMGAWPALYAALLIPAGRSKSGLPAWPFVTGSFALGAFALLPYFALHTPGAAAAASPPPAADLEGVKGAGLRLLESRGLALFLCGVAAFALGSAAAAGPAAWVAYGQLFDESRLVHVTTLDFITLTACSWSWVGNDARARGVVGGAPAWAGVPLLGPAAWLLVRPRGGGE